MRIQPLPAAQEKLNDKIIERLRHAGYLIILLFLASTGLGAWIYLLPESGLSGPVVGAEDGEGNIVESIVVGPDLVLSLGEIKTRAIVRARHERIGAEPVSTVLVGKSPFTLLRLESPTSEEAVSLSLLKAGEPLVARSGGQEWRGSADSTKDLEGYPIIPSYGLQLPAGAFIAGETKMLAGFIVQGTRDWVLVPARDVFDLFAELRNR